MKTFQGQVYEQLMLFIQEINKQCDNYITRRELPQEKGKYSLEFYNRKLRLICCYICSATIASLIIILYNSVLVALQSVNLQNQKSSSLYLLYTFLQQNDKHDFFRFFFYMVSDTICVISIICVCGNFILSETE